jgi:hypothetical protein
MKVKLFEEPKDGWCAKITVSKEYPRHWITLEILEVSLSDGSVINIPKGFIWDGASIPKWLWWLFPKIQLSSIVFCIHDFLYSDKKTQLFKHEFHIFEARKFADDELRKWGKVHFYNFTIEIFYFVIRKSGGLFYSKQFKLPN